MRNQPDPALINTANPSVPSSSEPVDFEVRVVSSVEATRDTLQQILRQLKLMKLGIEETSTVELVLAEALNNIVEHAYPDGVPPGQIVIECRQLLNGLHFRLLDHGHPMPNGQLPNCPKQSIDVDPDDLPEGGFGWFLIKDLARDVRYVRHDGENLLELRIAVAQGLAD